MDINMKNKINEIMKRLDIKECERSGLYVIRITEFMYMSGEKLKQLSSFDFTSGDEKLRTNKNKYVEEKPFYINNKALYILSEIARDDSLSHVLKLVRHKNVMQELVFAICEYLSGLRVFTSSMLWVILWNCTNFDADEIIHYYDIDRGRGRARVYEIAKQGVI